MHSFKWKPFLLVGAIVFIDFVVFKDHLITISRYLHTPCADRPADQVYYYYCDNISEISLFYFWNIIIMKELLTLENFNDTHMEKLVFY